MASSAISGVGTRFRRWGGAAYADIAEINSITGPGMTRDTIDVTSLDSTGGYREFIAGFRNAGTISLAMNFTRASYTLMLADFDSDTAANYEIVLLDDDNTTLEFEGLVTELPLSIPADDKITADVVIQITGQVVMNSGADSSV